MSAAGLDPAANFAEVDGSLASLAGCRARLAALAGSGWLARRVAEELAGHAADPTRVAAGVGAGRWTLVTAGGVSLVVARGDPEREVVVGEARPRLITPLGGRSLKMSHYRNTMDHDPDVLDPGRRPRLVAEVALAPGETLLCEAWRDVVDLHDPGPFLALEGRRVAAVCWTYARAADGGELIPRSAIAADPAHTRLEHALRLLVDLGAGAAGAVEACARLAAHPAHFVRWTAVRSACALDPERGRELLGAAAGDPHPHVRRAARAGLAALSEGECRG